MLKVLLQQISQRSDADVIIVDSESQEFMHYAAGSSARYISRGDDVDSFCSQLEEIVLEREMMYTNSGGQEKQKVFYSNLPPVYILIDDASYFTQIMSVRMDADKLLAKAMNTDVRIVAAINSRQFSGIDPVTKLFKGAQNGIILGKPTDQQILQVGLYRDNPQEDEGIVFENGLLTKIKIPFVDN